MQFHTEEFYWLECYLKWNINCVKSVRIRSYSVWMQENTDQDNSEFRHFSRSGKCNLNNFSIEAWVEEKSGGWVLRCNLPKCNLRAIKCLLSRQASVVQLHSKQVAGSIPSIGGWIAWPTLIQHKKKNLSKYWDLTETKERIQIVSRTKLAIIK